MCKTSSYFMGVLTGAAVGTAAFYYLSSPSKKRSCKKAMKSKAGKAAKKISGIFDEMM